MNVKIEDFLPKYPNIFNDELNDDLNPYPDFYTSVYNKKEFRDQILKKTEDVPDKKGILMKNQVFISRFLSSKTPYDQILLFHEMGSGKTCTVIGAIEQIRKVGGFKGAYIFGKGKLILNNFIRELRDKCTAGLYLPDTTDKSYTKLEYLNATKKLYDTFYSISYNKHHTTYETFARQLTNATDKDIKAQFSNRILVLDEVHNFSEQKDEKSVKLDIYGLFHRFLHTVENCKIILMTGTPMKDSPGEIAKVMNLILPLDNQIPFDEKEFNIQVKTPEFRNYFKGRVSFLKSMKSEVKKKFIGAEPETLGLSKLAIQPIEMSDFQTEHYFRALAKEDSLYADSRQASLFVFPDGTFGNTGFNKYLLNKSSKSVSGEKSKSFGVSKEFEKELNLTEFGNTDENKLQKLEKFSKKFAFVIREILKEQKKCFIYCQHVTQSGLILFSELLQKFFNFLQASGKEQTKSKRLAIFTNETASTSQIRTILELFNSRDNVDGEYIQVILGSDVVSEGLSFSDIQKEFILSPWFNYSTIEQSIARGLRLGSHKFLLETNPATELEIYQLVSLPSSTHVTTVENLKDYQKSVELYMYRLCEDKDIKIKTIVRIMMEMAVDCRLNYDRNKSDDSLIGTRECEYQDCNYTCEEIENNDEKDYSTFFYYTDSIQTETEKKIEMILKKIREIPLESLIKKLESDTVTKQSIKSFVYNAIIVKDEVEVVSYDEYVKYYDGNNVLKKIISKIETLFQKKFQYSATTLFLKCKSYRKVDVLAALKKIIDEKIPLRNKYGFYGFLKEYRDIFMIVDNIQENIDTFSSYYSENLYIKENLTFSSLFKMIENEYLPPFISNMKAIVDKSIFANAVKYIPPEIQESFIEMAISYKKNPPEEQQINNVFVDLLLDYFKSYIKISEDNTIISFILEDSNVHRCFSNETDRWSDCTEEQLEKYKESINNMKKTLESDENPNRYYGKINTETEAFVIVDLDAQKLSMKKKEGKKLKQAKKDINITSNRYPGKECKSWKKDDLIKMAVKLGIKYPEDINVVKTAELDSKFQTIFKDEKLSQTQIENAYKYLVSKKQNDDLCKLIKTFFGETIYNGVQLLIYDKDIGKQGYKKSDTTNKPVSKLDIKIYSKSEISKDFMKNELTQLKMTDLEQDSNETIYVCVFKNKKIKCLIKILSNNIVDIYTAASDKNKKKLIQNGLKYYTSQTNTIPIVTSNNDTKIRKFLDLGFTMSSENTMTLV
jgi:hypothetical protein